MRFPFVVFDMDGVIVDSEAVHELATVSYLRHIGVELDVGELTRSMYGRRTLDLSRALAARIGRPAGEVYEGRELIGQDLRPMPGLREAIGRLRRAGIRLALATSATRGYADQVLRALSLTEDFEVAVTGDDVRNGKPDPEIYLLAAFRLAADPTHCAAVEDSPNGVASAAAAGMHAVAVPNDATRGLRFPGAAAVVAGLAGAAEHLLS
ncbi:MAG: HAD family hydrolase [Candidatus Dormibacteraceae bacterium]